MALKCSYVDCYDNAKWIAVIDENTTSEKYLTKTVRTIIVTNTNNQWQNQFRHV